MNIESAEYVYIDNYPFLRLVIDNREALIGDFKYSIFLMGFVPLSSEHQSVDWRNILPRVTIPATKSTPELVLEGFTNDPTILKLTKEYIEAVNHTHGKKFKEGPVAFPL